MITARAPLVVMMIALVTCLVQAQQPAHVPVAAFASASGAETEGNTHLRDSMNTEQWHALLATTPEIAIPSTTPQAAAAAADTTTPEVTQLQVPTPASSADTASSVDIAQRSSSCPVMPFTTMITMTNDDTSSGALYRVRFVPSNPSITLVRMLTRINTEPYDLDDFPHMIPMSRIPATAATATATSAAAVFQEELSTRVKPGERLYLAFQYGLPTSLSGTMLCTTVTQTFQRAALTDTTTQGQEQQQTQTQAQAQAPAPAPDPAHDMDAAVQPTFDSDEELIDLDELDEPETETETETQTQTEPQQQPQTEIDAISLVEGQLDTSTTTSNNTNITDPSAPTSSSSPASDSDSAMLSDALRLAAEASAALAPSNDTMPYVPSSTPVCPSEAIDFDLEQIYRVRHAPRHAIYRLDLQTKAELQMKKAELHWSRDLTSSDLMATLPLEITSPHAAHHVLHNIPLKKDDSLYLFFTVEKENGEKCDSVVSQVIME